MFIDLGVEKQIEIFGGKEFGRAHGAVMCDSVKELLWKWWMVWGRARVTVGLGLG